MIIDYTTEVREGTLVSNDTKISLIYARSKLLEVLEHFKIINTYIYMFADDPDYAKSVILIPVSNEFVEKLKKVNPNDVVISLDCVVNTFIVKHDNPIEKICILVPPISETHVIILENIAISDILTIGLVRESDYKLLNEILQKDKKDMIKNLQGSMIVHNVFIDPLIRSFCEAISFKYRSNLIAQIETFNFIREILREKQVHDVLNVMIL